MRRNFSRTLVSCVTPGIIAFILGTGLSHGAEDAASSPKHRALPTAAKTWTGDFDQMVERRIIRVLVPFSRTLYFNDRGFERGITAENVRDFERYINQEYAKDKRPITVYLAPTTRDRLLSEVVEGRGDIAAGNITVTEERSKLVDFVAPADARPVSEIVVTGPKAPPINSADDLSGKTVHVRKATSYYESLVALNERFKKEGKAPVSFVVLPDALEDEDKMEMVNAGLIDIAIVDDWIAKMWAPVLPNIKVNEGAAVRTGGQTGWAIRKNSPQLQAAIDEFYRNHLKKQGVLSYRLAKYNKQIKQIKDPTASQEYQRFTDTIELFRKYGKQYSFDPVMLAAQGFQESQLNQKARSHVGAIGVMQVMPATGKELGVGDVRKIESNIHAGAKYMDKLMTQYFKDANFVDANRSLFAFASYNAGPGNISKMRKLAEQRGLEPDKWFNNVEIVTAERIGRETTTYVRNIYKYYVAYKLTLDAQEAAQKAREQVPPGK